MKKITEEQANEKFGKRWLDKCLDGNKKCPVRCADHHDSVSEVLEHLNIQLKLHKLQVVEVDMGGDMYYWFVEPI